MPTRSCSRRSSPTSRASDLIPKLVAGLLAQRTAGRWASTQENVFVLLALDRYFTTYESAMPDFVARAWLGERYAGSHAFRGRNTERQHLEIPMPFLYEAHGPSDLLLSKEGPGRLYYRIGLRYAPQSLTLGALDRGFTVERRYEGADRASDVTRDADGTWRIRAGARVRVRLTLVAPARRYHVALVDPLPAGLEPLNPALATTGSLPDDGGTEVAEVGAPGLGGPRGAGRWWWWSRPGSITRTCATTASRPSHHCSLKASTTTATSRARRPPAASACRHRRPRRCTARRPSGAEPATGSSSNSAPRGQLAFAEPAVFVATQLSSIRLGTTYGKIP